jgi:hypothetical protein
MELSPEIKAHSERITELRNKFMKEVTANFNFYTSNITSIVDIEQKVKDAGGTDYDVALLVEERLIMQRTAMIENRIGYEIDQKYLNNIVPSLREVEREKFKAYDINYVPSKVIGKPEVAKQPKMSGTDKAYAAMAARLGMSVEAYKHKLENALKNVLNVACSCAETPGICKVHVK